MPAVLLPSLVLLLCSLPAAADTISGRAVDTAGNPVADAELWVVPRVSWPDEPVAIASTRTAADGAFELPDVDLSSHLNRTAVSVVGYKPGLALCGPLLRLGETTGLEVVFAEAVPLELRVLDHEGKPVRARVRAVFAYAWDGRTRHWVSIPAERRDEFTLTTDETGAVTIPWHDGRLQWDCEFDAEGYGLVTARLNVERTEPVILHPPCVVRGRLRCDAAPDQVAGRKVLVTTSHQETQTSSAGFAIADAEGRFEVARLGPGPARVFLERDPDALWYAQTVTSPPLEPGGSVDVELVLERTYEVRGRAVAEDTGEPVAGLAAIVGRERSVSTGDDGAFRVRVLPGKQDAYLMGISAGYVAQYETTRREFTVTDADVDLGDFPVHPETILRGIVVDEAGRSVAGAEVQSHAAGAVIPPFYSTVTTDEDGVFQLRLLQKGQGVTIRARRGTAATTTPVKEIVGENDLVTVEIRENAAVSLRLRVVGDDGRPVAGAQVTFMWRTEETGSRISAPRTDADGVCLSEPLWPLGSYRASVVAPGYSQARSEEWKAVAGETHDFGDITLTAALAALAGVVVDTDGTPVAGSKITCNVGGPEGRQAFSDDEGRWRLDGLFDGQALVIAEKDDLLGAGWFTTGTEDNRIVVSGMVDEITLGEPRPAVLPDSEEDVLRRREIARELIERGLALEARREDGPGDILLPVLARLDPDRAFELSAGRHDEQILFALAGTYARTDPEQAEACARALDNDLARVSALARIASVVARTDPERARRICEDLIPEVLTLPQPTSRIWLLAECAKAMGRVDRQVGEQLARRAAELASQLGLAERDAAVRTGAAEALCRYDLDAALELIEGVTPDHYVNSALTGIAARIAADDPEQAIELLNRAGDWHRGYYGLETVYRIASRDPDRALEVARSHAEPTHRAAALGYVALAVRSVDANRAMTVFQEAVSFLWQSRGSRPGPPRSMNPAAMAGLAQIGMRIGYPHTDRLVAMSWALAPAPSHDPWMVQDAHGGEMRLLVALSFVDPEAVLPRLAALPAVVVATDLTQYSSTVREFFTIAGQVDPELVRETMNALLDRVEGAAPLPERLVWTLSHAIGRLLASPEDRYRQAMSSQLSFLPGDEDGLDE